MRSSSGGSIRRPPGPLRGTAQSPPPSGVYRPINLTVGTPAREARQELRGLWSSSGPMSDPQAFCLIRALRNPAGAQVGHTSTTRCHRTTVGYSRARPAPGPRRVPRCYGTGTRPRCGHAQRGGLRPTGRHHRQPLETRTRRERPGALPARTSTPPIMELSGRGPSSPARRGGLGSAAGSRCVLPGRTTCSTTSARPGVRPPLACRHSKMSVRTCGLRAARNMGRKRALNSG